MSFFQLILRCAVFAFALAFLSAIAGGELRLATTTSTENSGLLKEILPDFERECQCQVRVIPVGTGRALKLGENGDTDALLVHSQIDEEKFVRDGFGVKRILVMENDFILLGPEEDSAGIRGRRNVAESLLAIAKKRARFVSRGDESGTHKREKILWQAAAEASREKINFDSSWYKSAGVGMGRTILIADELRAYTISDRGTYLFFRDKTNLAVAVENEPRLANPYGVIAVNPKRHPHVNFALANQLIEWLISHATQRKIGEYRVRGEVLFKPAAEKK